MKDAPYSTGPITEKVNEIIAKTEQGQHASVHNITRKLNVRHQTVLSHLKEVCCKKSSMFVCYR